MQMERRMIDRFPAPDKIDTKKTANAGGSKTEMFLITNNLKMKPVDRLEILQPNNTFICLPFYSTI
jgi:hypothetical protein